MESQDLDDEEDAEAEVVAPPTSTQPHLPAVSPASTAETPSPGPVALWPPLAWLSFASCGL